MTQAHLFHIQSLEDQSARDLAALAAGRHAPGMPEECSMQYACQAFRFHCLSSGSRTVATSFYFRLPVASRQTVWCSVAIMLTGLCRD